MYHAMGDMDTLVGKCRKGRHKLNQSDFTYPDSKRWHCSQRCADAHLTRVEDRLLGIEFQQQPDSHKVPGHAQPFAHSDWAKKFVIIIVWPPLLGPRDIQHDRVVIDYVGGTKTVIDCSCIDERLKG